MATEGSAGAVRSGRWFAALLATANYVGYLAGALGGILVPALVRSVLVNGAAGVVVTEGGRPVSVMGFTVSGGKITEIDAIADPDRLRRLDLAVLLT